jgi:hypothetical protein
MLGAHRRRIARVSDLVNRLARHLKRFHYDKYFSRYIVVSTYRAIDIREEKLIAVIMKYPTVGDRSKDELFQRFVAETPGVVHAFQLESPEGGATVTVWESQEARDAYMATTLRDNVDTALPGLTREVYSVLATK